MDLTLSPEQLLLTRTARELLARACPPAMVRALEASPTGFDHATWCELAAAGWLGLELPSALGGSGLGFLDAALLCEELGRALLPSPFVPTVVASVSLLATLGSAAQQRRWLPAIAAGDTVATTAWVEPGWREPYGTPALRLAGDGTLSGTKAFVPFAGGADLLLVVLEGPSVVLVPQDPRRVVAERATTLGGDPVYTVRFERAAVEPLGPPAADAFVRTLDRVAIASLAYALGAAERALEMTVEHARTREQFGRPIGSFQAIAHRCADMRSDLDALRCLVQRAAWTLDHLPGDDLAVGAALAYGGGALRRIFMHAHQVHGAIGFSTEHDLQLFTRRAKATELWWGAGARQAERVATAMGL